MALADTARLATVLTLKDGLSPGLNKPIGRVGKFNKGIDTAGKKLGAFGGKLKTVGAVAGGALAGGLIVGIKQGLDSLGELESATTSVDAALKQMGKSGKVSAGQIAGWANEIEAATDAAFDDKAITAAATTLIRFGKVTTANLRPALEVMTDLAAKTGDVDSASSLLAKALADPTKAAARLTRQGIILTDAEEEQIKALVKAGKAGKAQAVVLAAIERSTKGAAKAMNGPYVDAQRKLSDAGEDGTKALAVGFLPIITRVSTKLQKALADPKVIANIEKLGQSLAGAFDEAVTFAEKIPWGAIASGLKTSAEWAGKLFDAFRSLPPEVQGTIVALAGLNKLSGGAVTGIVSELGKGLIKGVLGINAGVVNINAATVNGGGVGSVAGGGGAGKIATAVGSATAVAGGAAALTALTQVQREANKLIVGALSKGNATQDKQFAAILQMGSNIANPIGASLSDLPSNLQNVADWVSQTVTGTGQKTVMSVNAAKNAITANERGEGAKHRAALGAIRQQEIRNNNAFRAGERATLGVSSKLNTANSRLAAIKAKRMSFSTSVNVGVRTNVSVRNVNSSNVTQNNYGSKTTNKVL